MCQIVPVQTIVQNCGIRRELCEVDQGLVRHPFKKASGASRFSSEASRKRDLECLIGNQISWKFRVSSGVLWSANANNSSSDVASLPRGSDEIEFSF